MKTKILLLCLLTSLLAGCRTTTYTHGIPNFHVVDAERHIYRGGQPTAEGFAWLNTNWVTADLKLDTDSEGNDDNSGLWVYKVPIPFLEQLFYVPKSKTENIKAVEYFFYHENGGLYIHCKNGWDRTGYACEIERLCIENHPWTFAQARQEMLTNGFHTCLFGLNHASKKLK